MKDFIKWLGLNEKVGKVIVWLLIITIMLIITNTFLESVGLPYYRITVDNLLSINKIAIIDTLVSCIICVANFYSIILLVFRAKEAKRILKYAMLYMITAWIILELFGYVVSQIYIVLYITIFCFMFSNKKYKYLLYGILAYIFSVFVQGLWYIVKVRFIDYSKLSDLTKGILSLDYFIIMGLIILVKEIYMKKRGEKNESTRWATKRFLARRIQKRKNICTKTSKKSSKLS